MDSEISGGNKDTNTAPTTTEPTPAGTLWFDTNKKLGPIVDDYVTDDEILRYCNEKIDSDVFIIRNLSSIKTEEDAQRLRKYQERLTELLSKK